MVKKAISSYLHKNLFTEFKPKAVFFDMDGVLFDSMPNHSIAWVKAMNESGLPFTQSEAYMNEGQPGTDTINNSYLKHFGRESTIDEREDIYKLKSKYFDELGAPTPIQNIYDLLLRIKKDNFIMLVVTGSGQPSLLENIQTHFPNIFNKENIISAYDVKKGKPDPEPYLKALERANVSPWEAIVIENAPLGVRASSSAQIFTIGVNTGPLSDKVLLENGADIVFPDMKSLYNEWSFFEKN